MQIYQLGLIDYGRPSALQGIGCGTDTVVFGHTHRHGAVDLGEGKTYLNTGSWFHPPHYVKIEHGTVELLPWTGQKP